MKTTQYILFTDLGARVNQFRHFYFPFYNFNFIAEWHGQGCVRHPDPHSSALFWEAGSGSELDWKAGSGFAFNLKFMSFRGSKLSRGGPWMLTIKAWGLKHWAQKSLYTQNRITLMRNRIRIRNEMWKVGYESAILWKMDLDTHYSDADPKPSILLYFIDLKLNLFFVL